jgi:hypothetical protein
MVLPSGYGGTRSVALRFVDLLDGLAYCEPDLRTVSPISGYSKKKPLGIFPRLRFILKASTEGRQTVHGPYSLRRSTADISLCNELEGVARF